MEKLEDYEFTIIPKTIKTGIAPPVTTKQETKVYIAYIYDIPKSVKSTTTSEIENLFAEEGIDCKVQILTENDIKPFWTGKATFTDE